MLKTLVFELIESIQNKLRPAERPDLLVSSPHEHDADSEILFEPIDPSSSSNAMDAADFTCPVSRLPINSQKGFYQCMQCGTAYSIEGWEFLKEMAEGECCACRSKNTVRIVTPSREFE